LNISPWLLAQCENAVSRSERLDAATKNGEHKNQLKHE
jgi:hypothetical protein